VFTSENFHSGEVTRRSENPGIARNEGGFQDLGQSHVGSVVGGEVVAQGPDSGKENPVDIAFDRQICENLESLACLLRLQFPMRDETTQDLSDFDIQEVGCVKRGVLCEETFCDRNTGCGLQEYFYDSRGVEDDHRPSRSALTASTTDEVRVTLS
jgi:hypothetical protein